MTWCEAGVTLPLQVMTQGGFELRVGALPGGRWSLAGDARVVAEGEILAGAAASPSPPSWATGGHVLASSPIERET